jgi:hypothetical protein
MLCSTFGIGQEPRAATKVKTKSDRTVVTDKSKPVRRALEQQYEAQRRALLAKDLNAVMALRTPDFSVYMSNGQVWDFETSKNYTRVGFEQVEENLEIRFDIGVIEVEGEHAAAEIHQTWRRRQMKAGRVRLVETSARQRETWRNTPAGWRLERIDKIRPGAWYVDGKRIDPSKPYDPDAPEYKPKE